mgnify:CR=1 FL=1
MKLSIKVVMANDRVDHYEIYKNKTLTFRARGVECFLSNNPQEEFTKREIATLVAILKKPELSSLQLGRKTQNCVFFDWGYIWQVSRKGQRPRVFVPYGTEVEYTSIKPGVVSHGFTVTFKGVTVKGDSKEVSHGNMNDFFSTNKIVSFKLKRGNKNFVVTKNPENDLTPIVTSNGGRLRVFVGYK